MSYIDPFNPSIIKFPPTADNNWRILRSIEHCEKRIDSLENNINSLKNNIKCLETSINSLDDKISEILEKQSDIFDFLIGKKSFEENKDML